MIKIENFTKKYGEHTVYENFNLEVEDNKITCILGESGCGKTTLLNAIANLIKFEGQITPVKVSYVFQSPRLIPRLTVLKNLTVVGAEQSSCLNALEKVGLANKARSYPNALSGGEAQRVSLCRAFLYPSDIILMDEPFSSLDLKTKLSVMGVFKEMRGEENKTALFVTHDVDEALFLADRIIVLANGKISADFKNDEKLPIGASSPMREKLVQSLLQN